MKWRCARCRKVLVFTGVIPPRWCSEFCAKSDEGTTLEDQMKDLERRVSRLECK